jgi:hypothetical protein
MTDTYATDRDAIEAAIKQFAGNLNCNLFKDILLDHLSRVAPRGDAQPRRIEPPAYHMTNDQYTVDDAIRDAYAWAPDGQTYPSLRGWRVACWLLAKEVDRLRDEVLPDPAKPAEVGDLHHPGGTLGEILDERLRQDSKWGGPSHDDHHTPDDWEQFIYDRIRRLPSEKPFRHRMIEIAALAIAAVESYDRKAKS